MMGVSQNELARRAEIDPAYINRLERPKVRPLSTRPSRVVVLSICRAMNLNDAAKDRFLWEAGHSTMADWQTRAEVAEEIVVKMQRILWNR